MGGLSVGKKRQQCFRCLDHILWAGMEHLARIVLVVGLLGLPIAVACLDEFALSEGVHPSAGCLHRLAGDGDSMGVRVLCFGQDVGSYYGSEVVELLPFVAEECKAVTNDQAKQECKNRHRRMVYKILEHAVLLALAVGIGGGFFQDGYRAIRKKRFLQGSASRSG